MGVKATGEGVVRVYLHDAYDVVETRLEAGFCCKCFHVEERRCPPYQGRELDDNDRTFLIQLEPELST